MFAARSGQRVKYAKLAPLRSESGAAHPPLLGGCGLRHGRLLGEALLLGSLRGAGNGQQRALLRGQRLLGGLLHRLALLAFL